MINEDKESALEREARERLEAKDWAEKPLGEKLGYDQNGRAGDETDTVPSADRENSFDGTDEEWDATPLHEKLGYDSTGGALLGGARDGE